MHNQDAVGKAVVNVKGKHYLENMATCVQETGDQVATMQRK